MLFPEEDAPYLRDWIVKRIEKTSDADSEVLAEYIIALLKHDGDKPSIRKLCEEEIPDFLDEDTIPFLDDVFEAITFKSYRPGAPPPPKRPQVTTHSTQAAPTNNAPPSGPARGGHAPSPAGGSRKRGPDEMDMEEGEVDMQDEAPIVGRRAAKQLRRQARRKARQEDMQQQQQQQQQNQYQNQRGAYPMPMMFDPQDPMVMEAMAQMGMPFPPYPGFPGRGQQRRRGRCRDFDNKGYCSRAATCPYDHGSETMVPPNFGEYNPNDGPMALPNPANFPFFPPQSQDSSRGRGGRKARGGKKGGARAPYSADGPVHDQSKSTIVVENIPEENFAEETVRAYFSQFGNITDVSMQPYKHLAIVKYDKWASANAAYRSPKAIFDNRFVKVFWFKDADESIPNSQSNQGFDASIFSGSGGGGGAGAEGAEEEEMDPEEFRRRQEEAQKQHEEREDKRKELERQRQELQQKQQELIAKHREEVTRLHERLAQENGGGGDGESSGADRLRQKLLALEQEAKILGIDPDAPAEYEEDDYSNTYGPSSSSAPSYPPRGGYRGRGRGRGGGRGAPSWGASRGGGSFHGNEGRHAAYAQYSLDNRPRRLAISGADFSAPEKDEQLRHFLLQLGEFESVEQVPASSSSSTKGDGGGDDGDSRPPVTHVSFGDRKTAERFFALLNGNELPGVEGKLELSWLSNLPASSSGAAAAGKGKATAAPAAGAGTTSAGAGEQEGKADEEDGVGDAMAGNDDSQRAEMEVEYGAGDDDDAW